MNATTKATIYRLRVGLGAFAFVGLFSMAIPASGSMFTLVDGEGFEAPAYVTTQLEGQFADTFEGFGSAAWVQSPMGGTSTAVVQTTVVASGSQALEVNCAANSNDRWAVPITGAPAQPLICIDWDMMVEQTVSAGVGPFFGIEAYDDDATTILRVGSLGVDASTGDVLVTDLATGLVETGATVNFGEWYSYRMVLDYSTDTYYSFVDGTLVYVTAFESLGADQFTDADIAAIAAGADSISQGLTGTAYFDNYLVVETDDYSKIPEPSSIVAGFAALAIVAACRRR